MSTFQHDVYGGAGVGCNIKSTRSMTIWDQVLEHLRVGMPDEDFRRWFGATAYASDSGDQITVWVPSEAIRRHLDNNYQEQIARALTAEGRAYTHVRLVVSGFEDDDDETTR
jgi:chromosomal replication initiation ATPase DnaA